MVRSASRKVSQTAPLMKVSGISFVQGEWFDVYERSTGPFDPLRPASGLTKTAGAFHSDKLKNRPPYGDRFATGFEPSKGPPDLSTLCVPNHIPGRFTWYPVYDTVSDFPFKIRLFRG